MWSLESRESAFIFVSIRDISACFKLLFLLLLCEKLLSFKRNFLYNIVCQLCFERERERRLVSSILNGVQNHFFRKYFLSELSSQFCQH